MRIAVQSGSNAARNALEQLVAHFGHTLSETPEAAELLILDAVHPAMGTPLSGVATVTLGGENGLPAPLHPNSLAQAWLHATLNVPLAQDWQLDIAARRLKHPTQDAVPLTEKETSLLAVLARPTRANDSREALLEAVWGAAQTADTHTLDTHLYRLRQKLAALSPSPGDIVSNEGHYRWSARAGGD